MKYCLCCLKPFRDSDKKPEKTVNGWHLSCVKKFFGKSGFPDIDISEDVLNQLAVESTSNGFTIPGVQKKLSLHMTNDSTPRLTLVNYPGGYILKPQTDEYTALPELEFLIMHMAKVSGIKTVPFGMVRMTKQNNSYAYITGRIDRKNRKMLAMEDFCQLDGRLTEDKYRGSYERCGKIISKYSSLPGLDLAELYIRIVFSFVVGNSDMHLKNFSLIETDEKSNEYRLSEAYDMLSSNIVIPDDKEQLALTLNGKKHNIRKKDFILFAQTIGINTVSAEKMITKIIKLKDKYLDMCNSSYLPDNMKEQLSKLISQRMLIFEN